MQALKTIKSAIPEHWRQKAREIEAGLSLSHVSGAPSIRLRPNEAAVTCLVKNGEFYLDQFLDHYFGLGFSHIVLLDNGSTDATVERARARANVTVYRTHLSVGGRQGLLKKQLARRTVPAGWCLDVDIDELFDYPHSDILPLSSFLEYLNAKGHTAVVTQMLDMFSDRPLSSLAQKQSEDLKTVHRFYDISQVTRIGYREDALAIEFGSRNRVSSEDTSLYWGGIRKTVYGIKCLLTKHSLFRTDAGLHLFPHNHFVDGAHLADVSALLLHYKFASNAFEEAAQNQAAFPANSQGYGRIMSAVEGRPELVIKGDAAKELGAAADLLDSEFVFASEDYQRHVRSWQGANRGS